MTDTAAGDTARRGLMRSSPAFRVFWAGQSVSAFGDQFTLVALPTIAIIKLHASAFEVGLLGSISYFAFPVFGLFAGSVVDRRSRRRVLILSDLTRLLAVAAVPIAYVAGGLDLLVLFTVGFVSGVATCFFAPAYQAFLPTVAPEDDIVNGFALMAISNSTAQAAGPSLAGVLIGALGAMYAMLADAISYGVSVLSLLFVHVQEVTVTKPRGNLVPDVREGLRLVWQHQLVRRMTMTTFLSNMGRGISLEFFLLFAYRSLQLSPFVAGLLLASGGVGTIVGSAVCRKLTAQVGLGRALILSSLLKGLPWALTPLALFLPPIPIMAVVLATSSFFIPVWNVNSLTVRQHLTDGELRGRVSATVRTTTSSAVIISGVLGGGLAALAVSVLGDRTGLALVLVIGGLVWAGATLALPAQGLWRIRELEDGAATYGRVSRAPVVDAQSNTVAAGAGAERDARGD